MSNPYRTAVLADTPTFLLLDQVSGSNWQDETGNGHHGALQGAATIEASGAGGFRNARQRRRAVRF